MRNKIKKIISVTVVSMMLSSVIATTVVAQEKTDTNITINVSKSTMFDYINPPTVTDPDE